MTEQDKRTKSEIVSDFVVNILKQNDRNNCGMHRDAILRFCINQNAPLGFDGDCKKQLFILSSCMSKDARLKSVQGKRGYWKREDGEFIYKKCVECHIPVIPENIAHDSPVFLCKQCLREIIREAESLSIREMRDRV